MSFVRVVLPPGLAAHDDEGYIASNVEDIWHAYRYESASLPELAHRYVSLRFVECTVDRMVDYFCSPVEVVDQWLMTVHQHRIWKELR